MNLQLLRDAARNFPDEILKPFDVIYGVAGFDGLAALTEYFGGQSVYIPRLKRVLQQCVELEARKARLERGVPVAVLARELGYSRRHLSKIIGGD